MNQMADIVELRYIQYCSCRVAAMVASGNILRAADKVYYSETERTMDDLHTALEEGFLEPVTDDLALRLELASEHWATICISQHGCHPVSRNREVYRLRKVEVNP